MDLPQIRSQLPTLNILVVDDDPVARKVLGRGLETCGYKNISCVSSAKEALTLVKDTFFHVILCDVVMPDMDGLELLGEVRQLPNSDKMSVIMVSATEDLQIVYQCLNAGADDYMVKPINIRQLKNLWSNLWKKKKERTLIHQLQEEKSNRQQLGRELQHLQSQLSDLTSKIDQAVDTPITAITRTISELQCQENLTSEVQNALSQVLHSLASSNLYKPAFDKILSDDEVDRDTKTWLMSELSGVLYSGASDEESQQVRWSEEDETKKLRSYDFNVWAQNEGDTLLMFLQNIYEDFGLLSMFGVEKPKFKRFITKIRDGYLSSNPYHNFIHGFDVTQTVYSYLTTGKAAKYLTHIEIFGLLTACVCHDLGHFGLNNNYLISVGHELAIRYNDQSVLENFHCANTFEILRSDDCNIFSNLDRAQYTTVRKIMVSCIMATDPAKFMELLNKFQAMSENFRQNDDDHRLLLAQILIKSADISNPTKPFPVSRYWAGVIQEEFFRQGDVERREGLPISGFMDRENPNLPGLQIGFADYIVIPLFTVLEKLLPSTKVCLDTLLANRDTWEKMKDAKDL